jgi:hypothetical protein
MSITVNNNGGNFVPPPFEDGEIYFCRGVQVVDLGMQSGGEWEGQPKPDVEQVMVTFEFSEVRNQDDKPAWLSAVFSLPKRWPESGKFQNMHVKSNLYKFLNIVYPEGLYPSKNPNYVGFANGFDWKQLLNKPVQFGVRVNDEGRAYLNMSTMGRVPSKLVSSVGELENTPVVINMDTVTTEQWEMLFPWVRTKIANSLSEDIAAKAAELNELTAKPRTTETSKTNNKPKRAKVTPEDLDDDIPF